MLGADYLHNGRPVMITMVRIDPVHGKYAHIQQTKPCGGVYGVRERPKGFRQHELVEFSELTEVENADLG